MGPLRSTRLMLTVVSAVLAMGQAWAQAPATTQSAAASGAPTSSDYFDAVAPVIFKVYKAVPLGNASRNCPLCDSPGSSVSEGIVPWLVASKVLSAPTYVVSYWMLL